MDYLSLFIIWIIICILLWMFNKKYRNYTYSELIPVVILDSMIVFIFLYLTTLNGYITGGLPILICILGSVGLIYYRIKDDKDFGVEITLEMAKKYVY